MKSRNIAVSLALVFAIGCAAQPAGKERAGHKPSETGRIRPSVAVARATVTLVNTEYKFVVIDFDARSMPALGATLELYRAGKKAGSIRLTEPVRGRFATADILEGDARVGDEVR
jgi:hypothetical protein